jgi:hypothetical protein
MRDGNPPLRQKCLLPELSEIAVVAADACALRRGDCTEATTGGKPGVHQHEQSARRRVSFRKGESMRCER